MIQIDILCYGAVVKSVQLASKRKACEVYARHSEIVGQYIWLTVGGVTYSTARARKYFGMAKI